MDAVSAPVEPLAALLARIANGDRAALEGLYRATSAKLFGVCLRILNDRQEAEDVLQEVYVTVWQRAGRFDSARASAITWLATIARNRAIDRIRGGSAAIRRSSEPIEAAAEIGDATPGAETMMMFSQERLRLADCLDTLQPEQAACIREAFLDGSTYEQLAVSRGVPLGTMKSTIRRGLQRLKACLES